MHFDHPLMNCDIKNLKLLSKTLNFWWFYLFNLIYQKFDIGKRILLIWKVFLWIMYNLAAFGLYRSMDCIKASEVVLFLEIHHKSRVLHSGIYLQAYFTSRRMVSVWGNLPCQDVLRGQVLFIFPLWPFIRNVCVKNPRRPARQKYVVVKFGGYQPGMKFPAR